MLDRTCPNNFCQLDWCGPLLLCDREVGRIPATIGGVYLLHAYGATNGRYEVIYAGKAADLAVRLVQHLRTVTTAPEIYIARARMRLYFSAAPVLDPVIRAGVETGLILRFRPPFNRQIPTVAPIATSLPPTNSM